MTYPYMRGGVREKQSERKMQSERDVERDVERERENVRALGGVYLKGMPV